MKPSHLSILVPFVFAGIAVATLVVWARTDTRLEMELRVPGLDKIPVETAKVDEIPDAPALPTVAGPGLPSTISTQWPAFRGPDRDAICKDGTSLARSWPAAGPPHLWTVELGQGYAAAAVAHGCVYVLDYDEVGKADTLRCLSLDDGREIWHAGYPADVAVNHGMSRTVPAISGDYVVTYGPLCQVACWDAKDRKRLWFIDLRKRFHAEVPGWYAGQCPLIDGDRVILAPGGDALLAFVDLKTGAVLKTSANPRGWQQTHVSVMPMEVAGRRMFVYVGTGGVAGVDAETCKLLWDTTECRMQMATSPSALVLSGGRILCSSGYNPQEGAVLLQVVADGNRFRAKTLQRFRPREFNSEQQTPIWYEGYMYGVRKRGKGPLVCMELKDDKLQEVWNSGRTTFGHGPYLIAQDMIFLMDDEGVLTLAQATPQGYRQLAQHRVFEDGRDAWGPMALVEGRLIVRDMTRMTCLDVSQP